MGNIMQKHRVCLTRWFVCFLSLPAILLSAPPAYGFAGGDGSPENPYQVETAEHLDMVREHLDAHFIQVADMNLNVAPWDKEAG